MKPSLLRKQFHINLIFVWEKPRFCPIINVEKVDKSALETHIISKSVCVLLPSHFVSTFLCFNKICFSATTQLDDIKNWQAVCGTPIHSLPAFFLTAVLYNHLMLCLRRIRSSLSFPLSSRSCRCSL